MASWPIATVSGSRPMVSTRWAPCSLATTARSAGAVVRCRPIRRQGSARRWRASGAGHRAGGARLQSRVFAGTRGRSRHWSGAPPAASALLLAQLLQVFQPLQDLALEAAFDRLVELLARHAVGEIVLSREAVLGIVVVLVTLAVADLLHELGRRIEDMHRRRQRAVRLGRPPCRAEGRIPRIPFPRGPQIHPALAHPHPPLRPSPPTL